MVVHGRTAIYIGDNIKGDGMLMVMLDDRVLTFSERFACADCGISYPEIEPRLFSFNNPFGACPDCDGLGTKQYIDPELVVPDPDKSLRAGAIAPWSGSSSPYHGQTLDSLARHYGFSTTTPWRDLPKKIQDIILFGSGEDPVPMTFSDGNRKYSVTRPFEGAVSNMERRWRETDSQWIRDELSKFQSIAPCETIYGLRLKPEALAVKIAGLNISDVSQMSIHEAHAWFSGVDKKLSKKNQEIAERILREIRERLGFLTNVGLEYLTLSRNSGTLSGGESQRIRLARQAGCAGIRRALDRPASARQCAPADHAQEPARYRQYRHRRRA